MHFVRSDVADSGILIDECCRRFEDMRSNEGSRKRNARSVAEQSREAAHENRPGCSTTRIDVKLERIAREAKIGLWSGVGDQAPVPPWEFRKKE